MAGLALHNGRRRRKHLHPLPNAGTCMQTSTQIYFHAYIYILIYIFLKKNYPRDKQRRRHRLHHAVRHPERGRAPRDVCDLQGHVPARWEREWMDGCHTYMCVCMYELMYIYHVRIYYIYMYVIARPTGFTHTLLHTYIYIHAFQHTFSHRILHTHRHTYIYVDE